MTPTNTTAVRQLADVSVGKLNESQKLAVQAKVDRMVAAVTTMESNAASAAKGLEARTDALVGYVVSTAHDGATDTDVKAAISQLSALDLRLEQLTDQIDEAKKAFGEMAQDGCEAKHRLDDILAGQYQARRTDEQIAKAKADILAFEFPADIQLELPTA